MISRRPTSKIKRMVYALLGLALVGAPSVASSADVFRFRRDGATMEVFGKQVVAAADGGRLVLAPDGVLWSLQPTEQIQQDSSEVPFQLLSKDQLIQHLGEELPDGFEFHQTAHYIVCHNTTKAYAQWCGALYERLYRAFLNFWRQRGMDLQDPEAPLIAIVFDSEAAYEEYSREELGARAGSIIGYYSFRTNRITSYDLTGIDQRTSRVRLSNAKRVNQILMQPRALPTVATIVHEATHQLAFNCGLHQRYADIPLWVSEGLAVYFETPDLRSKRGWRGIGNVNPTRLRQFRRYLPARPKGSLATLIVDDHQFRDPRLATNVYAESWAFCHFLLNRHPREFTQYMKVLSQKKPMVHGRSNDRLRVFKQSFTSDLGDLDESFLRYVAGLR